jgi:hypothetical protein
LEYEEQEIKGFLILFLQKKKGLPLARTRAGRSEALEVPEYGGLKPHSTQAGARRPGSFSEAVH